jgi:hypothetical protein
MSTGKEAKLRGRRLIEIRAQAQRLASDERPRREVNEKSDLERSHERHGVKAFLWQMKCEETRRLQHGLAAFMDGKSAQYWGSAGLAQWSDWPLNVPFQRRLEERELVQRGLEERVAAIFVSISEHHAVAPHDLQRIVWDAFEQYQPYVNGAGVCETEHAEGEFREPVRWHTRRSKVYRQASMVAEGND